MKNDFDIIMISTSRWDDPYSSASFSLAKELAKNNRVFYIDHPFTIRDFITHYANRNVIKSRVKALLFGANPYRKVDGLPTSFTVVTPKVVLPINWLKEGMIYNILWKINDTIVQSTLKRIVKDFSIKKYIFFNSYDPFYFKNIPKQIAPVLKVYQTIDDITQEEYTARHGTRLEAEAVRGADIVLATSRELVKLMSNYTSKVHLLANAVDFTVFNKINQLKLDKPKEIININKKIICYTGNIGTRINYELLKKIAIVHVDKILLLVGPLSNNSYKEFGLDKFDNIIFTGSKNITELPHYLQHSDCLIIPFEYSILTKSIYPLKINEYLASGKPVVATAFSEDIQDFSDVAYIVETDEEFLQSIDQSMLEDSKTKVTSRVTKAAQNTWQYRASLFWATIESELNSNN